MAVLLWNLRQAWLRGEYTTLPGIVCFLSFNGRQLCVRRSSVDIRPIYWLSATKQSRLHVSDNSCKPLRCRYFLPRRLDLHSIIRGFNLRRILHLASRESCEIEVNRELIL